jgi:tetratricopeptide (TPR) repeat protein
LNGQGVIYTATMPPPPRDPRPQEAGVDSKTVSEWEQARRQLRGEKPEPEKPGGDKKNPSLADVLLKSLADNGHHFTQLADGESLTVVITFREPEPTPFLRRTRYPDGSSSGAAGAAGGEGGAFPTPGRGGPAGAAGGSSTGGGLMGRSGDDGGSPDKKPPSSAREYELLGDLHLKQENWSKAIDAYKKAVEYNPEPKQVAVLYQKLARSHLGQAPDNHEAYQKVIEKGMEWLRLAQGEAAKASQPAPSPLPAKLIVSAPKKLLDQAGAGKVSFEEFKKAATVEYLTAPAPATKPPDKAPR